MSRTNSAMDFFVNSEGFVIRRGRFRAVAGSSYVGNHPLQVITGQPHQQDYPPRISFFSGCSNFHIDGGEFVAIGGNDIVDLRPPTVCENGSGHLESTSKGECVPLVLLNTSITDESKPVEDQGGAHQHNLEDYDFVDDPEIERAMHATSNEAIISQDGPTSQTD